MTGMSTAPSLPPRALFTGLIDDAAVFPPGNYPLPEAISRREQRRGAPYAELVGPLLLPPPLVSEAVSGTSPLTISVVGRPGADLDQVLRTAQLLVDARGHSLAGLEIAHHPDWRKALELSVPLAIEVTPDAAGLEAIADLHGSDEQVRAKLRTGSTSERGVPTTAQVAAFLAATVEQSVSFKLTGGLHHAVAHTATTQSGKEEQHGFLNVLLATGAALNGESSADVSALLAERDSASIVEQIRALDASQASAIRDQFHSFGCCNVLDPIGDLSALKLIEETV